MAQPVGEVDNRSMFPGVAQRYMNSVDPINQCLLWDYHVEVELSIK